MADWDFLTNHAHVLFCIARDERTRLRDVAECVGITERAAHRIVCELEEAGYLTRHRVGRRNEYELHVDVPLEHPVEEGLSAGELLAPLLDRKRAARGKAA